MELENGRFLQKVPEMLKYVERKTYRWTFRELEQRMLGLQEVKTIPSCLLLF